MLDMKFVRENLPAVQEMLKHRCNTLDLSPFTELEERRRRILQDVEEKKARRNAVSKEVGARKKAGENADEIVAEMRSPSMYFHINEKQLGGEKPFEVASFICKECCFCTRIVIQSPRRCPWIAQMARLKPSTPHLHRR